VFHITEIEDKIIEILEKEPSTPEEISRKIGISWNTAQNYLLKLSNEKIVRYIKKGRVNIYFLNIQRGITIDIPSWVKIKSLKEISDEIEDYFDENLSAQDMIEKERRKC